MFALLAMASCSLQDDKDIFDDSSANRMEEALKADKAILVNAKNGWLMEYYPSADLTFGGYNILVHFDENGKATLSGELQGSTKKVTSLYRLKQSAGPVLTFDSYNEIIHFFGEPLNGLDGDYEFTVMNAEPNKVVLSGTKSKAKIVMTPLADGTDWEKYLDNVLETQAQAFLGTYNLVVNGNVIGLVEQDYNTFSLNNNNNSELIPFMYTETGIKFHHPMTIGGVQMENFTLDAENVVFNCTDAGVDAKLVGVYPDGYKKYNELEGTYKYGSKTVTITAKGDNKYTIHGLTTLADIEATYSRKAGSISIVYQFLGVIMGYQAYLCPWDTVEGYLTWQVGSGMDGVNSATEPLTITFKDNGVYKTANAFLVYAFTGTPSNDTAKGSLDRLQNIELIKQ